LQRNLDWERERRQFPKEFRKKQNKPILVQPKIYDSDRKTNMRSISKLQENYKRDCSSPVGLDSKGMAGV
jgi:hypothetical protein